MPIRTQIDVDVDDAKFREFMTVFENYRTALLNHPGEWSQLHADDAVTRSDFVEMVAILTAQAELLHRSVIEAATTNRSVTSANRGFEGMSRATADIATNVYEMTRSLLEWTGIAGIVTGLVGYGALWGVDHLAAAGSNLRRESIGLGLSAAGLQSFTAFERFVDPHAYLGKISHLRSNAEGAEALFGVGMRQDEWEGKDTEEVGVAFLRHARELGQRIKDNPNFEDILAAKKVTQVLSPEEVRRLASASDEEFGHTLDLQRTSKNKNQLNDEVLRSWTELDLQLGFAKTQIENTLINGLAPLAPEIEKLSSVAAEAIAAFLDSDEVRVAITNLATYIGSPAFQKDVKEFSEGILFLVTAVVKGIEYLVHGDPNGTNNDDPNAIQLAGDLSANILGGMWLGGRLAGIQGAIVGGSLGLATNVARGTQLPDGTLVSPIFDGPIGPIPDSLRWNNPVTHPAAASVPSGSNVSDSPDVHDLTGWTKDLQTHGQMDGVQGMIVHHTAGGKSVEDIVKTFESRGLASNFVIDPAGSIYRILPAGQAGAHIKDGWGAGQGLTNKNVEGVEIIAADDKHVTQAELDAALRLIRTESQRYGYDPKKSVFGHGEVNPGHKDPREGMRVTDAVRGGALDVKVSNRISSDVTVTSSPSPPGNL